MQNKCRIKNYLSKLKTIMQNTPSIIKEC